MLPVHTPGQGPAPAPLPGPAQALATPVKEERIADMAAISVTSRVPEFWTDHPRLWFLQTEAVLSPQKLSDEARYNLVVTKLSKEAIQQVTDILISPPDNQKYEALKQRLLTIYEESETRQLQKLISEMELGDQRPSQLLRRMRDLARSKVPDETLKILWQGHLPPSVRGIIAVTETGDLDVLARIADKIMETAMPTSVAEVRSAPTASPNSSDLIIAEIQKIHRRIDQLQNTHHPGPRRSRSIGRDQGRSTPADRSTTRRSRRPDWQCFYHFRYKERATKCIPPCSYKQGN